MRRSRLWSTWPGYVPFFFLAACTHRHGTVYLPNCRDVDSGACSVVITSHMLDEAGVPAICGCIQFTDGQRSCNPPHCDEVP
jgi:hypothetical protein